MERRRYAAKKSCLNQLSRQFHAAADSTLKCCRPNLGSHRVHQCDIHTQNNNASCLAPLHQYFRNFFFEFGPLSETSGVFGAQPEAMILHVMYSHPGVFMGDTLSHPR